jgi:hypothetical protein
MADNRDIIGWFYRNGKRIPIKGKKKDNKVSSDRGNTTDLDNAVNEARGVRLESSVAQDMRDHNRVRNINGDRVELYGNSAGKGLYKKESATFNQYFDGGKELINFRREPWNEGLRRNAKGLGRTRAPRRSKGNAFGVPRQHSMNFLRESKARRFESNLHSQGAKNVQVTGTTDAFGQRQNRVEWDEPKRKKK